MKPTTPPARISGAERWEIIAAVAALALATVAAYRSSFAGVFVFDDEPAILRNATLRQVGTSLFPPADAAVSGRPVANVSFAINHAISGTQPWSYHLANLGIHLLAALTLFGIVRRTLRGRADAAVGTGTAPKAPRDATLVAFAAALLWAVHPLQTESVTYVVQRVESLMGLFFLLTVYGFIRSLEADRPWRWRGFSVGACLLGMATKEVMVVAPVLVLLYDRTFAAGSFRHAWRERRAFHLSLAATWLPLVALVAATGWTRGGTAGFGIGVSAVGYWLTQFVAVLRYLCLAVWPAPQVFDYPTFWIGDVTEVLPGAVVLGSLAFATGWALWRRPALGFLGMWFFLLLAPTSLVPGTIQMIVEHRMYLPLAAVTVLAAAGLHALLGRRGVIAATALAAGLVWITAGRNGVYRSEKALWTDTLAKRPDSDRAHNNLGNVLLKAGDVSQAIAHWEAALRLRPDYAEAHYNLANALRGLGRSPEAIAHYEQALSVNPRMPDAHTALGAVLAEAGRSDEAAAHLEEALRLAPRYTDAWNQLGLVRAAGGRIPDAIACFEKALAVNDALPEVRSNLGNALRASGRMEEAIAQYRTALRLEPANAAARNNLGNAYRESGRLPEALAEYEQALRLTPDAPQVRNNLGITLLMLGRAPEAITQFELALRRDPQLAQVHVNLAIALDSVGRSAEAAAHIDAARRLGAPVP